MRERALSRKSDNVDTPFDRESELNTYILKCK